MLRRSQHGLCSRLRAHRRLQAAAASTTTPAAGGFCAAAVAPLDTPPGERRPPAVPAGRPGPGATSGCRSGCGRDGRGSRPGAADPERRRSGAAGRGSRGRGSWRGRSRAAAGRRRTHRRGAPGHPRPAGGLFRYRPRPFRAGAVRPRPAASGPGPGPAGGFRPAAARRRGAPAAATGVAFHLRAGHGRPASFVRFVSIRDCSAVRSVFLRMPLLTKLLKLTLPSTLMSGRRRPTSSQSTRSQSMSSQSTSWTSMSMSSSSQFRP